MTRLPTPTTYNDQNQFTAIGSAYWVTYDDNGNLTTDAAHHTYVYDAWNRLIGVKNEFGLWIKGYAYDGLGRRVLETDGFTSTDLYYSGPWQVLEERKGVSTSLGASNSSNGYAELDPKERCRGLPEWKGRILI